MTDPIKIRILSVDDHPLMHEGIAALVNSQPDMMIAAEVSTGGDALRSYTEHRPDIVLMDLRLPDMNGIDAMISILEQFPEARVIILTMFQGDVEIQRALRSGARGYMLKTMPPKELVQVIRSVQAGRKHIPNEVAAHLAEHLGEESLTVREIEVLGLISGGNRNRDIADQLFIAEETVKVHIKHIMEKLGASDRTQAVAIAIRRGIIQI